MIRGDIEADKVLAKFGEEYRIPRSEIEAKRDVYRNRARADKLVVLEQRIKRLEGR